jgi:hypothetical protein
MAEAWQYHGDATCAADGMCGVSATDIMGFRVWGLGFTV